MAKKIRRRRGRKRGRRKRHFEGNYKSSNRRGQVMINKTPARQHNVIAPHYYTRLQTGFNGVLSSSATQSQVFGFASNVVNTPLGNSPGWTSAPPIFTGLTGASLIPSTVSLANLQPAGLPQLLGLYSAVRVYASKIQVTFTPTALGDLLLLCVFPVNYGIPGTYVSSIEQAMSMPYSKVIQCSANNNLKQNTIQMYLDNATLLGLTKQQYQDYGSGTHNVLTPNGSWANAGLTTGWNVIYQLYSGSTSTQNIGVEVRMTQYCEFFIPEMLQLISGTDQP